MAEHGLANVRTCFDRHRGQRLGLYRAVMRYFGYQALTTMERLLDTATFYGHIPASGLDHNDVDGIDANEENASPYN